MTKHYCHKRVVKLKILFLLFRELNIDLPVEDGQEGMVGLLWRTIYGTPDAAHQWDIFLNVTIVLEYCQLGLSSLCLYRHNTESCIGWRHGNGIMFVGEHDLSKHLPASLSRSMVLKRRALLGW